MAEEEKQKLRDAEQKVREAEYKYSNVKQVLESLFEALDNVILAFRVILYVGSVGMAWFYMKDKALAVAIGCSFSAAHVLIFFREYLADKKRQLTK